MRLTSHCKNYNCYETQNKPRWEATFKGRQDSYRVVEPMTMMMIIQADVSGRHPDDEDSKNL
jgi:hypothetical protein